MKEKRKIKTNGVLKKEDGLKSIQMELVLILRLLGGIILFLEIKIHKVK